MKQTALIDLIGLMYLAVDGRTDARPGFWSAGFLQLAGHPMRWRLLRELARSDR
jgi:hypothetical protein